MKKITLLIAFLLPAIFCFAQIDSLDIKIGQMIMVGMSGKSAKKNSAIIKDIKKGSSNSIINFYRSRRWSSESFKNEIWFSFYAFSSNSRAKK